MQHAPAVPEQTTTAAVDEYENGQHREAQLPIHPIPVQTSAVPTVIKPMPITEILEAFNQFQQIKRQLLTKDDVQSVSGDAFVKKSGWRKIAMAFGLTDEIINSDFDYDEKGNILSASFQVRAIAPNGRYATGWASCSLNERPFSKPNHDIPATAHTRAKNRAISDLVGGGEVSAEEITDSAAPQKARASAPTKAQLSRFNELIDWAQEAGEITAKVCQNSKEWARGVTGKTVGAEINKWKKRRAEVEHNAVLDETGETKDNPDGLRKVDADLDHAQNGQSPSKPHWHLDKESLKYQSEGDFKSEKAKDDALLKCLLTDFAVKQRSPEQLSSAQEVVETNIDLIETLPQASQQKLFARFEEIGIWQEKAEPA